MQYSKPAISIDEQLVILQERGLIIDDIHEARDTLYRVSYFRLADYWRPMEVDKTSHIFKPNTHFNDILTIYRFDTELKQIIFNAILQIEITVRSKMIRYFSENHDPFWFADETLSEDAECFQSNIAHIRREIKRSQEDFITEHFGKVDMEGYKEVWQGLLPDEFTLEDIFEMCNCRHPRGYEGHSMSVSDIVIINGKRWFCNDIGWKEMDK